MLSFINRRPSINIKETEGKEHNQFTDLLNERSTNGFSDNEDITLNIMIYDEVKQYTLG